MAHNFTREELYKLVWSEPMKTLAARHGISDVGFSKACRRYNIPTPERGYWAKLAAGKKVQKRPLPPRGPGMSEVVCTGGDRWNRHVLSDEEIFKANPSPPTFSRDIEDLAAEVRSAVGPLSVPKVMKRPHRFIAKLLENDEERRRKAATEAYVFSWDKPLFDSPFEKRRLRLINAIFTALEGRGMKPWLRGKEARDLGVQISDASVSFTVDDANVKPDRHPSDYQRPSQPSGRMKISIGWWRLLKMFGTSGRMMRPASWKVR